jgi:hypothetical protein
VIQGGLLGSSNQAQPQLSVGALILNSTSRIRIQREPNLESNKPNQRRPSVDAHFSSLADSGRYPIVGEFSPCKVLSDALWLLYYKSTGIVLKPSKPRPLPVDDVEIKKTKPLVSTSV